jgi:hypothetical protein
VALGMTIPVPTPSVLGLALILVVFTWASRFITVFPTLYAMRQGLRASLLPPSTSRRSASSRWCWFRSACNRPHHARRRGRGVHRFVVLAVLNTFLMMRSDARPGASSDSQAAWTPRSRSQPRR